MNLARNYKEMCLKSRCRCLVKIDQDHRIDEIQSVGDVIVGKSAIEAKRIFGQVVLSLNKGIIKIQ